jgi:hypothetical protein
MFTQELAIDLRSSQEAQEIVYLTSYSIPLLYQRRPRSRPFAQVVILMTEYRVQHLIP